MLLSDTVPLCMAMLCTRCFLSESLNSLINYVYTNYRINYFCRGGCIFAYACLSVNRLCKQFSSDFHERLYDFGLVLWEQ